MKNLPLASSTWDKCEIDAIMRVIKNDRYTMGNAVQIFEQKFATYFGSKYAVMVNSGSSANLLTIAALCYKKENPLQTEDEIIVPSLSWSTTYYPVQQYNMKLVFVDIDLNTLNIDCNLIENAITDKTKAILAPNILGNPANLIKLKQICEKYNLYLIEDNCESMGSKLNDKYTGTYGICGTFSTFFSHHISTMEGGVIVTNNEELYHIMLAMRSHGWTRHLPEKNTIHKKLTDSFYESFNFILPGYNIRPVEMSGAIGIEQLKKLDQLIKTRRSNAAVFKSLFEHDDRFIIQQENGQSSWFGFSMIINNLSIKRNDVLKILDQHNIEFRPVISGNILRHKVIKYLSHRIVGTHKNSNTVHDQGFFIGNHHIDIQKQLSELKQCLKKL